MLVVFSPIFVANTKIIFRYDFVAPLTILTGKNCVLLNSVKNGYLATPDLFHVFTQSMKFYTFHYHVHVFFYKKIFYNKMSLKNSKTARKC